MVDIVLQIGFLRNIVNHGVTTRILRLIEALQHAQLHIEVARAAPETAHRMEKATGKNTKPILDGKNTTLIKVVI